jgi:hypothetical protein
MKTTILTTLGAVALCSGAFAQGIGNEYCALVSTQFSTGSSSTISATGSASIMANDLVLSADNLPDQPGIFIAGPVSENLTLYCGHRCIGSAGLQRFTNTTSPSGGVITEAVDYGTAAMGGLNVMAGATMSYQRWNRDPAGAAACGIGIPSNTSNYSSAIEIQHTL